MGGMLGKRGSLVVDHSMDEVQLHNMGRGSLKRGSVSTITTTGNDPPIYESCLKGQLETPQEKKARKRSHKIVYCLIFVQSISISISLGVWPYLHEELVPSLTKKSLAWVGAANPFGMMVAGPLFGIWANKTGSIRPPCIAAAIMFITGNVMFALLGAFKGLGTMAPYYGMIVSRFTLGGSSGTVTLCWSYLASSTTVKKRTLSLNFAFIGQACGLVIGPVIQSLITMALPEDIDTAVDWFKWNKYTVTSFVSASFGLVILVILLPCVFKEYNISEKEGAMMTNSNSPDEQSTKFSKLDYGALGGILYARFGILFVAVLTETLAVPVAMDQYAWSENTAMIMVGSALSIAGVLNIAVYILGGILSKRVDERLLFLGLGMLPVVIGMFLFIPWGKNIIPMQTCDTGNETTSFTSVTETTTIADLVGAGPLSLSANEDNQHCSEGCPEIQDWCHHTPQLPEIQFMIGFFVAFIGFASAQSFMVGIYSKMLGPKPQGVWMGVIGAAGSLSRVSGPIVVSYVYFELGTRWCFGILTIVTAAALLGTTLLYRRLVPMRVLSQRDSQGYDGPGAEGNKI
ncbi:major facilitator superfamily domain-containing protein 8 [Procambarus clarkii]|uniref:major facilitator superfamily domain-containing protein 8 n=1 Tax=Procambarus clarkii TaxID=6728 RepID=UPI001E674218|nr:major facilitator superfamily domain-containing protein 8-like [Procambarus clarkii]XP_045619687.1 major facilitator superfamily domain-containing protein 8-like [Procambarus clarkii]XP_045619696.1 major facilitator superfamily domain-containing protein 8-like [Procambarus clarkii]